MAFLTVSWFFYFFLLFILTIYAGLYLYAQKKFRYWKIRNVYHTNPKFPIGDYTGITGITQIRSFYLVCNDLYKKHGHEKLLGFWIFFKPAMLVNDVELVKRMLVEDFQHFHDRGIRSENHHDPLSDSIFVMKGQRWRSLRKDLMPVFTAAKLKTVFPTLVEVADKLAKELEKFVGRDVHMGDLSTRFSVDVINYCAFGLESSSLENPDSELKEIALKLNERTIRQQFLGIMLIFYPKLLRLFRMNFFPDKVNNFFLNLIKDITEYRRNNQVERKDFMQILIRLLKQGYFGSPYDAEKTPSGKKHEFRFDTNSAAAQAFIFWLAGFETSALTMEFAAYELCKNPEVQKKLQKEIDSVKAKHNGKLTFEGLQEMQYLDMVVSEVLRMYPIAPVITRECTENYNVPNTGVTIEKGTPVFVDALGIQRDAKHYPEPNKFDPERFSTENASKRDPYTYMPFGVGPRICIGKRFGLVQVKAGLASILSNFNLAACERTPKTIKFDECKDLLQPECELPIRLEKR